MYRTDIIYWDDAVVTYGSFAGDLLPSSCEWFVPGTNQED